MEEQEINVTESIEIEPINSHDPEPIIEVQNVSYYETADYTIELVHELTLGDILVSTLLTILIVITLLSRLFGGRS